MEKTFEEHAREKREEFRNNLKLEGFKVEFPDSKSFREIMKENFSKVFDHPMSHYVAQGEEFQRALPVYRKYEECHHENMILTDEDGKFVGHFCGESEDHSSFYLRNAGLIPEYRRQKIATKFMEEFLSYLYKLGYARVTSQHHPTNNPVLIMMLRFGFYIAGVETREEWGTLIKCVKLLSDDREKVFIRIVRGGNDISA